jgi:heme/copper-type cytochrome/quinol oxidase subunit 3
MEIPYTVRPRPDTGLANPKLGIWLFLASEVMLFGGLFAGYIFMRLGAEPWMWPHGWLNVPVGTMNTFILILSSVTIILSWESLKMRRYKAYKMWLLATWVCGLIFLTVKLAYEWPEKFHHFGAYVQPDSLHKYETNLGNEDPVDKDGKPVLDKNGKPVLGRRARKEPERRFISGHVHEDPPDSHEMLAKANVPYIPPAVFDGLLDADEKVRPAAMKKKILHHWALTDEETAKLLNKDLPKEEQAKLRTETLEKLNVIHLGELDPENASPYDPDNDKAHFLPRDRTVLPKDKELHIDKRDLITGHGSFVPKLNTYLASYFMITGLHGAHVLGGCIVFIYFWLNIKGGSKLYHTNPQQLCNRIEVAGLFWHLVDLIWIFVFPLFYLL